MNELSKLLPLSENNKYVINFIIGKEKSEHIMTKYNNLATANDKIDFTESVLLKSDIVYGFYIDKLFETDFFEAHLVTEKEDDYFLSHILYQKEKMYIEIVLLLKQNISKAFSTIKMISEENKFESNLIFFENNKNIN